MTGPMLTEVQRAEIVERLAAGLPVVGGAWRRARRSFSNPRNFVERLDPKQLPHAVRIAIRIVQDRGQATNEGFLWILGQIAALLDEAIEIEAAAR